MLSPSNNISYRTANIITITGSTNQQYIPKLAGSTGIYGGSNVTFYKRGNGSSGLPSGSYFVSNDNQWVLYNSTAHGGCWRCQSGSIYDNQATCCYNSSGIGGAYTNSGSWSGSPLGRSNAQDIIGTNAPNGLYSYAGIYSGSAYYTHINGEIEYVLFKSTTFRSNSWLLVDGITPSEIAWGQYCYNDVGPIGTYTIVNAAPDTGISFTGTIIGT